LAEALGGSIHLPALATLLAGNVFSPHDLSTYWGPPDITTDYLYVGIVPLVAWLFWGGGDQYRSERRFWSAVLLLSLLYAIGTRTPFYEGLYHVLPGMTLFHRPADALFLTVPALGLLGAMALDRRLSGQPAQPHWLALAAIGALLVYTFWIVLAAHRPQALTALLYSAVMGGILLWLLRHPSRPAMAGTGLAIVLLCAADLRLHNVVQYFNAQKNQDLRWFRLPLAPDKAKLIAQLQTNIGHESIPERAELFNLCPLTNGDSVFGISNIFSYNPMIYSRYARMFGTGTILPVSAAQRTFTEWAPDFSARAFDLLGLRKIVSGSTDNIDIQYRASVLPRILNPTEVRFHEDDLPPPEAFRSTDFNQTLWLPAEEADKTVCQTGTAGKLRIGQVKYTANTITIEYAAAAPAWLVLNEIHMPGWYARIGDEEIPLLRGNGMFRAMCVPAGAQQLTVAFSPLRFVVAGWQTYHP
jgi:hypothetical protein